MLVQKYSKQTLDLTLKRFIIFIKSPESENTSLILFFAPLKINWYNIFIFQAFWRLLSRCH